MTLYNNRATIAHIDEEKLYLFNNIDNKIIMDYYSNNEESKQETIVDDALEEFDIVINEDKEIYLIYQDVDNHLRILTIDKEVINDITLTKGELPKIYELNMIQSLEYTSIIYLILKSNREGIFEIHHYILDKGKWKDYIVEEIKVDKFLNNIKIIEDEEKILLCYYYENQICLKEFDFATMKWQESIILTDNKEKLYMDIIKQDNYLHLVYSRYENENLIIEYARYLREDNSILLEKQTNISNEGNPSNPTLIMENGRLWISWNESANLFSRYSQDMGESWSPIYLWKKSRFTDMIRYKYMTNNKDKNILLDYTFGTMHPDIQFLGFGPLNEVEEIMSKKKVMQNIWQL